MSAPTVKLPILRLEVSHDKGVDVFSPNDILMEFADIDDPAGLFPPLTGMGDTVTSVLSGEPAVIYRTADKQIPLTPAELKRLVMTSLEPQEMLKLKEIYGVFHEIHDDFYHPTTGQALQPR